MNFYLFDYFFEWIQFWSTFLSKFSFLSTWLSWVSFLNTFFWTSGHSETVWILIFNSCPFKKILLHLLLTFACLSKISPLSFFLLCLKFITSIRNGFYTIVFLRNSHDSTVQLDPKDPIYCIPLAVKFFFVHCSLYI